VDNSQLAELNRQILRLSRSVKAANIAIRDYRANQDRVERKRDACLNQCCAQPSRAKACAAGCTGEAQASLGAAGRSINATRQRCRLLLQSIGALNDVRADVARSCHFEWNAKDIPPGILYGIRPGYSECYRPSLQR
jgi:hypothetical protein